MKPLRSLKAVCCVALRRRFAAVATALLPPLPLPIAAASIPAASASTSTAAAFEREPPLLRSRCCCRSRCHCVQLHRASQAYLSKHGVARFATHRWAPVDSSNQEDMLMHLSNSSINQVGDLVCSESALL